MKSKALLGVLILLAAVALTALPSHAAVVTVNLQACASTATIGGAPVAIWTFAAAGGACSTSLPGPLIVAQAGDTVTINLTNNLPVPTSIVIPGFPVTPPPPTAFFFDAQARRRARSFTTETAAGQMGAYSWTNVKPGTYLYHSGTQPQVQVQMGLYGGLKIDAAAGPPKEAYPGVQYATDVVLLYSEVDPDLHAAVASGAYGTTSPTSTFDYKPKYFLINGAPYVDGVTAPIAAAPGGQPTLIRLLSAALKHHTPTLNGGHFDVVAEDGNKYPFPKKQYSVNLSPLKTFDLVWVPTATGLYGLYDRALGLLNNATLGGGMFRKLEVAAAPTLVALDDGPYPTTEDIAVFSVAAPGVLGNDTGAGGTKTAVLVGQASHGKVTLAADGSFNYTPALNFAGTDSFTYRFTEGAGTSNVATASIAVANVADNPVAVNDAATALFNTPVTIQVLANDSDPDPGSTLAVTAVGTASPSGSVSFTANSVTYTPVAGFTGTATFNYTVSDGALTAIGTVTVTVQANKPPVAKDDTAQTKTNVSVTINVVANDTDPDGTIAANTVVITANPNKGGTAVANANGTVTFTPKINFRGSDVFSYTVRDNNGAVSNPARVTVNVVR